MAAFYINCCLYTRHDEDEKALREMTGVPDTG